jgi:hypothetical protein
MNLNFSLLDIDVTFLRDHHRFGFCIGRIIARQYAGAILALMCDQGEVAYWDVLYCHAILDGLYWLWVRIHGGWIE